MKKTGKEQLTFMDSNWGVFDVVEGQIYYWKIGDCNFWIKKDKSEIYFAWSHEKYVVGNKAEILADLTWSRFTAKEELHSIEISSVLPDKPLVVKPEDSFYLTSGTKKTIYVRIPVWICISMIEKNKAKLIEIPSVILSNTWFGNLIEGELCYWLTSSARSQIESDPSRPFMAISPLTLENISAENLLVEKFVIHIENSTLFMANGQLWTDEILIYYKGKDAIGSVEFKDRPPKHISGANKITEPRKRQNKRLLVKTFDSIIDNHILGMPIKK